MSNLFLKSLLFIPFFFCLAGSAQADNREADTGSRALDNQYQTPRPAVTPYDRPTYGDPRPVYYPKHETLGDTRSYRNTNPRTCTSLLCD